MSYEFIPNRKDHTLLIRKSFRAARSLVWKAYTEPKYLEKWFAPKPFIAKTKHMDFSEGGYWLYAMIEPSGTEHWGRTDFVKITPEESYISLDGFSNSDGELNTELPRAEWKVSFIEQGEQTTVESLVQYGSLAELEQIIKMGMEPGMQSTLDRLDELLLSW